MVVHQPEEETLLVNVSGKLKNVDHISFSGNVFNLFSYNI